MFPGCTSGYDTVMPPEKKAHIEAPNRATQTALGLGYQFLAATLVFIGGGYLLDAKWGGGHTFTLIGVALTFLYEGYEVWKLVREMNQEDKK